MSDNIITVDETTNAIVVNGTPIIATGGMVKVISAGTQGPAGGGVTDHGALNGLSDDDHPQYLNNARGDARYAPISHAHSIADVTGLQTALNAKLGETFETVSKNLKAYPAVLNYSGGNLTSIVYTIGAGSITKTLNYTSGALTSIVLSGDTPSGIELTKTLNYTTGVLTSISYS